MGWQLRGERLDQGVGEKFLEPYGRKITERRVQRRILYTSSMKRGSLAITSA